jgi:hypothetical protein
MITHADSVMIYLHIPRTGGTTLSEIVHHQYAGASILQFNDTHVEDIEALSLAALARADVLVGHVSFGVHRYLRAICMFHLQDQELYVLARQLLDTAIAREGTGFWVDLWLLRFLNSLNILIRRVTFLAHRVRATFRG